MTEGGGGKGGGRERSYFADFLSTAAVWCVPFCLGCSVPSVYVINFKRKKTGNAYAIFNGGVILVIDYVRMEVTLVGSSWVVVAGGQTGVDFFSLSFIVLNIFRGI